MYNIMLQRKSFMYWYDVKFFQTLITLNSSSLIDDDNGDVPDSILPDSNQPSNNTSQDVECEVCIMY